jgi:hypothetical protein
MELTDHVFDSEGKLLSYSAGIYVHQSVELQWRNKQWKELKKHSRLVSSKAWGFEKVELFQIPMLLYSDTSAAIFRSSRSFCHP